MVIAAVVSAGFTFAVGGIVLRDRPIDQAHWADAWWTLAGVLATLRSAVTVGRATGRQRAAWRFFTAACFSFTVGMGVWDWYELGLARYKPFSTPGEPFFLLVSILYVIGFVAYRSDRPSRARPPA